MVVVSRSQLPKIRQVRRDLPDLVRRSSSSTNRTRSARTRSRRPKSSAWARNSSRTRRPEFEAAAAAVRESDPANICYTSGTTADPKGIILTHRNYTANIEQSRGLVDCPEHYVCLIILPWDHSLRPHVRHLYR